METTRVLKDVEVPDVAVESIKVMNLKMIDEMVGDFIAQLFKGGHVLDQPDIQNLKEQILLEMKITMKVSMKVDLETLDKLGIVLVDEDQASIESF